MSRKQSLDASLAEQMRDVFVNNRGQAQDRAGWLIDQMENYIDRFRAFRNICGANAADVSDDELFWMVEIAANRLMTEVDAILKLESKSRYRQLISNHLEDMRARNVGEPSDQLKAVLDQIRIALASVADA